MSDPPGLRLTRLRADLLFCIDPGYWLEREGRSRRLAFLQDGPERVAEALRADRRVHSVEGVRSLFDDTHRREHATLTTMNFEDIAPLNIRLADPVAERVGPFDLQLSSLRLARDGPLVFPFTIRFAPENGDRRLLVPQLLRDFAVIRESTQRAVHTAARRAYEILKDSQLLGAMSEASGEVLSTLRRDVRVWCLPGGLVEPGETVSHAVSRELAEEIGVTGRPTRLVGIYCEGNLRIVPPATEPTVVIALECTISAGHPGRSGEVADVGYFPTAALPRIVETHPRRILDAAQRRACPVVD